MRIGNVIFAILSLAIASIVITEVFIRTIQDNNASGWSESELIFWLVVIFVAIAVFVYNVLYFF
jgi:TRAP-type mannitol/chloroaromatic compound transport system permease small subunit